MQNFKKLLLSTFLGGMLSINVSAQANLIISGGNSVSSLVCTNRKVYTWGSNTNTFGTGLLGNGSTAAIVTTPTPVTIPGGLDIQQINSGSGSHFLALTCETTIGAGGGIFAWGNNQYGQVGNGTNGNNVNTPSRVKLGVLATQSSIYDPTGTGNITAGISVVYAASLNSYAITTSGNLIAWGANDMANPSNDYDNANGQLGDGTTISKTTPVFVKTANGANLTGVIQVYAGDNVTYALADPDGDGIGTVYSWGYGSNGALGRNAAGTSNPASTNLVQDSYARPVYYNGNGGGTGQMNNIIAISAADVFGMALDEQGYVWTWGNGGWNNATGNTIFNYTGSDPRRVIAGNTTGSSNDGSYLLAKSIGGGQGYGMVVTADGKPVAWGGQGLTPDGSTPICTYGGLTGTGVTTAGIPPTYIKRGATVDNDVLSIFRGDTWGYYQRADGSIYTWGCNIYGQLGIGNTTNQTTAVAFTPPSGCSLPDPKPYVNLTPYYADVCASKLSTSPVILNSGFVISASLASRYTVTWEKGNSIVKTGTATAANLMYSANSVGTYSVTIKYVGSNVGCTSYPEAYNSTIISAYPKNFTTPSTLTYCGSTSTVNVNSTGTDNPVYKFYPTAASSSVLGSTVGSASTTIDLTTATTSVTDKIVYVEQANQKSGIVLKKSQVCDTTFNSFSYTLTTGTYNPIFQSGFTTIKDNVTLTTLNINLRSSVYTAGSTLSATLNFGIYGSRLGNGGLVANDADLIGTFIYDFSRTRTTEPQDLISDYLVTVNIKLPKADTYFISTKPTALTSVTGSGYLNLGGANCNQTGQIQGLPSGIISYTHNSQSFQNSQAGIYLNQGHFFNVGFATSQGYCDRVPVTLKQSTDPGCTITEISEINELNNSIRISPSPFKDQFMLETSGMEKVSVLDQRGVLIEEKSLVNLKNIQLGQTWSSGLYMLQLVGNGTVRTVKVIKEQ